MGILDYDYNQLAGNPLLQMGLGILANNTGHYGQFAPAFGMGASQGLVTSQQMQNAQERLKFMRDEMTQRQQQLDLQNREFDQTSQLRQMQMDEHARKVKQEQEAAAALTRLGNPDGYVRNEDVTTSRPVYSPQAPQEGAQAPNFGLTKEMVQSTTQVPYFDKQAQMRDMWAIPEIRAKLIEQQFRNPELMVAPDGTVLDKNDASNIGKNFRADRLDPNKPFIVVDGKIVPNVDYQNYEIQKAGAGAARQNVTNVVSTDKKYGEILGTKLAEQDAAAIDAARAAPSRLDNARRIKQVLDANPITGSNAEWRLSAQKFLASSGLIDGTQVKSTEDLASLLAQGTLDAIKTSGLGAGQGFTDKDRQFLERAKSGNIEINAGTLRMLADLNEKAAIASIERGNQVIDQIQNDPNAGNVGQRLQKIDVPQPQKNAPVPPKLGEVRNGYKFMGNPNNPADWANQSKWKKVSQ